MIFDSSGHSLNVTLVIVAASLNMTPVIVVAKELPDLIDEVTKGIGDGTAIPRPRDRDYSAFSLR